LIASVGEYSGIYIWTVTISENWSAFAPDFREIEENIEYQEREDEFDNIPVRLMLEQKKRQRDAEEFAILDMEEIDENPIFFPKCNLSNE
jgi:COMPASS component SWD1